MRSLSAVLELFPQTGVRGLTDSEVAESQARFGTNRLTPLPREPAWKKFLVKFDEPIIKVLLAASLLKIIVDLFEASPAIGGLGLAAVLLLTTVAVLMRLTAWIPALLFTLAMALVTVSGVIGQLSFEGLAVMIAVFLATGVSFLSEFRSDQEFEKLNAARDSIRVKVQRNGAVRTIPQEEVVVGDRVLVQMGDEVPADSRVMTASEVKIDQSLLTGESEPVPKNPTSPTETADGPEVANCAFRGTQVVEGAGDLIVANVGDDTMIGQIARRLSIDASDEASDQTAASSGSRLANRQERVQHKLSVAKTSTPLQEKLEVLATSISRIGYVAAIAIFFALLARGLWIGEVAWPRGEESRAILLRSMHSLLAYFVYMVIIVVVAVPEGLPMSVTISLAIAWRKMSQAHSLVRQLVACETIGSATVICTDKTGTLTENKMTVARIGIAGHVYDHDLAGSGMIENNTARPGSPLHWIILNAATNSSANLELKNGKLLTVGNSTEGALLNWLRGGAWIPAGPAIDYVQLRASYPIQYQIHFSSDRKRMTSVVGLDGQMATFVKGAPEALLACCEHYLDVDGSVRELTTVVREQFLNAIATAAADAMRTLAFGHVPLPTGQLSLAQTIESAPGEAGKPVPKERVAFVDPIEKGLIFTGFVAIRDPVRADVPKAIQRCKRAGIEVKMITGDTVATARAIGKEIGLLDSPTAMALTSVEFNAMTDDELKARMPDLRILARALPRDKYRLVGLLQEQKHVVAMTGDGTNDAPALKRADVGLAMGIAGTEVAKEASKIVLLDDSFQTIVRAVQWGRALYENIQRFVQFQLTINFSALTIAFLGPFLGIKPPFTVLQLLWINVIMDTFAAIALCSEPARDNLMLRPPKRRDEKLVTPQMSQTIFITAGYFVVAMLGLLLGMQQLGWCAGDSPLARDSTFSLRQTSIFFTVYVLFQVWNQINCRSLSLDESGFHRLFENRQFLAIATLTLVGQVLIVSFGGALFNVEPLGFVDWLIMTAATASVLVFSEIVRRLRRLASPATVFGKSIQDS